MSRVLMFAFFVILFAGAARAEDAPADVPFTAEYYYKVKWGYFNEFMDLYKKNHWPLVVRSMMDGDILSAEVERPMSHTVEAGRWDLRVTITFKNVLVAHGLDDRNFDLVIREMYPDEDRFKEEERRRFELLEEHLDVEIIAVSTEDWPTEGLSR